MKLYVLIIAFGFAAMTYAEEQKVNADLVADLALIGQFEHTDDVKDFLSEISKRKGVTSNEFSRAIVEFAKLNEKCASEHQHSRFVGALFALTEYGTTNAIDYLEYILKNKDASMCGRAMPAYMKLAEPKRKVAFLSEQIAKNKDFGSRAMRSVYGRFSNDIKRYAGKPDVDLIVNFLKQCQKKEKVHTEFLKGIIDSAQRQK